MAQPDPAHPCRLLTVVGFHCVFPVTVSTAFSGPSTPMTRPSFPLPPASNAAAGVPGAHPSPTRFPTKTHSPPNPLQHSSGLAGGRAGWACLLTDDPPSSRAGCRCGRGWRLLLRSLAGAAQAALPVEGGEEFLLVSVLRSGRARSRRPCCVDNASRLQAIGPLA